MGFCGRRERKGSLWGYFVMFFCSLLSFLFFMSSDKHLKPNIPNELSEPGVLDVPRAAGEPGSFK